MNKLPFDTGFTQKRLVSGRTSCYGEPQGVCEGWYSIGLIMNPKAFISPKPSVHSLLLTHTSPRESLQQGRECVFFNDCLWCVHFHPYHCICKCVRFWVVVYFSTHFFGGSYNVIMWMCFISQVKQVGLLASGDRTLYLPSFVWIENRHTLHKIPVSSWTN